MSLTEISPTHFTLSADSPLRKQIQEVYRWYSAKFSPRDVPCFADIGSLTENPAVMRAIRDFLVKRYKNFSQPPTHIMGFDARGFLLGPMIAVELGVPFVLLRKAEKNGGVLIASRPFEKEYKEKTREVMTIRDGSINRNSRVLLVDDVLATGGTVLSGLQLVEASGAIALEVVTILGLTSFGAPQMVNSYNNGQFSKTLFLTLVDESIFSEKNCGDIPNYMGPRVITCAEALSRL